jgi:hypothetical protein
MRKRERLVKAPGGGMVSARWRDESPIQYYRRTGVVDDRFQSRHHGRYYCNPAHCLCTWKSKKARDKHLDLAYAALS